MRARNHLMMRAILMTLIAASGVAAAGGPAPIRPAAEGYVLPDSESWDLKAMGTGEVYRILVSKPEGAPPPNGFPVLYVLDGNTIFASFAEARRLQEVSDPAIGKTLIVAIGYPNARPYDYERRMEDFTPPFPTPIPAAERPFEKWKVGGNERFAKFLLEELRPALAARYSIDLNRQSLFGHSLGGLFALHMLYRHPKSFHAIVAASPSIWWNDQAILAEERDFATQLQRSEVTVPMARLLLLVGDREETRVEGTDAEALAQRLAPLSAFGLRSHLEILRDEPHLGVPTRAITTTLRSVFAWP